MKKALIFAIAFAAVSLANADSGSGGGTVDVSSIMNGISTQSATNEINANISDYQNDIAQATPLQKRACRDTAIETVLLGQALIPSPVLQAYGVEAFANGNFGGVPLVQDEQNRLRVIENAPNDTDLERIENQIHFEQLAMIVSTRSYADAIESYKDRAEAAEYYGKLLGVDDRCNQYSLQIARDNDMIAASQRLLELYSQADAASTDAIDQMVNQQLSNQKLK